jgi:Na+/H+ antiporter NhaD/arsenite permease-like protein
METFVLLIFVLGYLAITLEHNLRLDKLIPALLMMALAWAGISIGLDDFTAWFDSHMHSMMDGSHGTRVFADLGHEERMKVMEETLLYHFGKTAEILIFLIGAMTIVEIIDHFNGFATIQSFVRTNQKRQLLWIMAILAFVLSAIIDNLTATIVLITILRKLVKSPQDRLWFAGLIVIAANAGGAWSPIGDVTTTMLWIGKKVSSEKLIEYLILPSLVCMAVPVLIASFLKPFKGTFEPPKSEGTLNPAGPRMLYLGLGLIVFVPAFKTFTHLPPYIGMMMSLGVFSMVAETLSRKQFRTGVMRHDGSASSSDSHHPSPTFKSLSKIELPSLLFFLGILMTVAALESLGMVFQFGNSVQAVMNTEVFVLLLGAASAIIDNVPLVAASMGMFNMDTYPMDSGVWHFIAYAAGTGGSMLIIGSAAGVVAMGMERISFFWYLKKISWLALLGYLAGAGVYMIENAALH